MGYERLWRAAFRSITMLSIAFLGAITCSVMAQVQPPTSQEDSRGVAVRLKGQSGQMESLYDESHALVIGVSEYASGWHNLPSVVSDVIAVGSVLKNQGFNVRTVLNPTYEAMDRAIRDFISECGQKDRNRVLLYFSGHGHTEELKDGRDVGYIVPADAPVPADDPQRFNRRAISMDEIESFAKKIKAKHALFVFDSCFSGTI